MHDAGGFVGVGLLLGLSAGFAPGPLLTLVVSETLRRGVGAGIRVAIAPVLTDLPIILLSLLVLGGLSRYTTLLGLISLCGALVVSVMAIDVLRSDPSLDAGSGRTLGSLYKGVLANALSPHPYLFWISVGGPLMLKAEAVSLSVAVAFVVAFYVTLLGSKVAIAVAVGRSRAFLAGGVYRVVLRVLGVLLLGLALGLFYDGLQLIGLLAD